MRLFSKITNYLQPPSLQLLSLLVAAKYKVVRHETRDEFTVVVNTDEGAYAYAKLEFASSLPNCKSNLPMPVVIKIDPNPRLTTAYWKEPKYRPLKGVRNVLLKDEDDVAWMLSHTNGLKTYAKHLYGFEVEYRDGSWRETQPRQPLLGSLVHFVARRYRPIWTR